MREKPGNGSKDLITGIDHNKESIMNNQPIERNSRGRIHLFSRKSAEKLEISQSPVIRHSYTIYERVI